MSEDEISAEYACFFPCFVWAVRDFTLDLEINGKPVTPDEYLENSLKLKRSVAPKVLASNSAWECIRNYFPSRKCSVFSLPVRSGQLKIIDQLSDSDLDREFVIHATDFCSYIFKHSQVKTFREGIKVNGSYH